LIISEFGISISEFWIAYLSLLIIGEAFLYRYFFQIIISVSFNINTPSFGADI